MLWILVLGGIWVLNYVINDSAVTCYSTSAISRLQPISARWINNWGRSSCGCLVILILVGNVSLLNHMWRLDTHLLLLSAALIKIVKK